MADDKELALLRQAEHRADAKIGFRKHLIGYVAVNATIIAVNLMTSPDRFWFLWPLLGWGVGVVAHWAAVYVDEAGARQRAVEAELERLKSKVQA